MGSVFGTQAGFEGEISYVVEDRDGRTEWKPKAPQAAFVGAVEL